MAQAYVKKINGTSRLVIDGEVYGGMTATVYCKRGGVLKLNRDYYKRLGDAGIKIFFVMCDTDFRHDGAYELFRTECETIIDAVPDGYIIPRVGLHPSDEWMESHPSAAMQFSDGIQPRGQLRVGTYSTADTYGYSIYSHEWRRDASAALVDFMERAEGESFGDRIIGYFLCAGATSEWHPTQTLSIRLDKPYYDVSEDFKAEYRRFLVEKYGDDASEPTIPDNLARQYILDFDTKMTGNLAKNPLEFPNILTDADGRPLGSFDDATKKGGVLDFYMAWSEAVAESIVGFAKLVKERSPDKLTGCFFGYTRIVHQGANFAGLRRLINSGVVDFCAAPGDYENRQPGGSEPSRSVVDTYPIHNMLFFAENDTRTHYVTDNYRSTMSQYDLEDSISVIKRNFGRGFCGLSYGWWFDMNHGGGWYDDPTILDVFRRQSEIASEAGEKRWQKCSEVAFVYDIESRIVASHYSSHSSVSLMKYYSLPKMGLPYDEYLLDDIEAVPDYKLYIFAAVCHLTDAQRDAIRRKLQKNNATALWMYGSGYIDPDAEVVMSPDNMSTLVGFDVKMQNDVIRDGIFRAYGESELAKKLKPRHRYGKYECRMDDGNLSGREDNPQPYLFPRFTVDCDESEIVGKFAIDGETAVAARCVDGFTSIFCGSKFLPADFLRAVAEVAGCHVYSRSEDVLYVSENYITFHASTSGRKVVTLPRSASPVELYDGREYGENVREFAFDADEGQTLMFGLR